MFRGKNAKPKRSSRRGTWGIPSWSCFPQQPKLMGSSAQICSGVYWCRRRVRFNEVPEKVPEGLGAE